MSTVYARAKNSNRRAASPTPDCDSVELQLTRPHIPEEVRPCLGGTGRYVSLLFKAR